MALAKDVAAALEMPLSNTISFSSPAFSPNKRQYPYFRNPTYGIDFKLI